MTRVLITAMAIAMAAGIYSISNPAPAYCATCSVVPCTVENQCGQGCSCLKFGSDAFGSCVNLD